MAPITESTPTTHTVCDTVIQHLAADEALLRERVAELEGDVVTYRNLLQESLHVLHDVTLDRDRLRERYHHALDELRTLRPRRAA